MEITQEQLIRLTTFDLMKIESWVSQELKFRTKGIGIDMYDARKD